MTSVFSFAENNLRLIRDQSLLTPLRQANSLPLFPALSRRINGKSTTVPTASSQRAIRYRSPNKRRKAPRDHKTAGISIYIRCVCPGYIRAYVCSYSRTFLTKPRSSFRPGYVAKVGIWDFRRSRSLSSFAPQTILSVDRWLVADSSPLQAWILRNEVKRNGVGEWESGRAKLRVGIVRKNERAALATANCYHRSSMGGIKRELEPNLCRRACLMASLYGIERDGGRVPETS